MEIPKDKQGIISIEQVCVLEKYLMDIRYELKPDSEDQSKLHQSLSKVLTELSSIHQKIHNIFQLLSKEETSLGINEIRQSKLAMYYFQVLNLLLINFTPQYKFESLQPSLIVKNFAKFTQIQAKISTKQSKAFKAFLIFYFNLIKRLSSSFILREQLNKVFVILSDILRCYFASHSDGNLEKVAKFKEETQWMGFIFQSLPTIEWKSICQNLSQSFLKNYLDFVQQNQFDEKEERTSRFHIIHMLGNFLHLVIQSKTTTEIVKGYECPIVDVKEMYSISSKDKLCNIKLRKQDAEYISELLITNYIKQKAFFRQIFTNKEDTMKRAQEIPEKQTFNTQENEIDQFDKNTKLSQLDNDQITVGQLIIEIINVLNSVMFLGGYNPKLQNIIYQKLFENNILPQFLQLAYIIYNERRFMGKHSIKITMAKLPEANLSRILDIDYESIQKQERSAIFKLIGQEIKYGQLSVLLRLMTNMVHINNGALGYFEKNVRYLHMIMSLTHDSEMNLTMKNWAVLFIKNCCDSQVLRQEISKIKIEMKVEE